MSDLKFQFGNVVVVDDGQIGVVVKLWANHSYDVYVRFYQGVKEYPEHAIKHFIYSKVLTEDEYEFYN